MSSQDTPLTLEIFNEAIMPRIEEVLENGTTKFRHEVLDLKQEVITKIDNKEK